MTNSQRTWIFLRGLGRNQGHWGDFPKLFQEKIEMLDLVGTGTEAERLSPWKISDFVDDLRNRRRTKGPVSILAISMGAMVASAWAEKYPEEIEALVLINTSSRSSSRFYERLQASNYFPILEMLVKYKDRRHFEDQVLELTAPQVANREQVLERHLTLPETSLQNWLRHLKASSAYSFPEKAPIPKTLFLTAKRDTLVHPDCSKKIAKSWGAICREHPGGAHDLPLVEPDWILEQIKEFL